MFAGNKKGYIFAALFVTKMAKGERRKFFEKIEASLAEANAPN